MKKRTFTADEKARIVLEVLRGEKELGQIASENDISANQIRNWKKDALDKLTILFDAKRDSKLKQQLADQERELEQAYKKVGQLTTKVDWLEKNLRKSLDLAGKVDLLRIQDEINNGGENPSGLPHLPLATVALILDVNRTSAYYTPKAPSDVEIEAKHRIDELHTEHTTWGSRQLSRQLTRGGIKIGRHKTRRYMEEMSISVTYPKPNTSKPAKNHTIYPYLLKNFTPTRPNQAWSIDITYIRLKAGFVYLTAIIDWYSRYIVGWELDDTLSTGMVLRAIKKAFAIATPKILNSYQGSQFTSHEYIGFPRHAILV